MTTPKQRPTLAPAALRAAALRLGAALGLLLWLIDAVAVGPHPLAGAAGLALSAVVAVAGHALWCLAVTAAIGARRLAGIPVALAAGAHLACVGVRGAAGEYPTWAALQMLMQSPAQLVGEGLAGYRTPLGLAAAAAVLLALAWPWLLTRVPTGSSRAFRGLALGLGGLLVASSALGVTVGRDALRHGVPLGALLLSRAGDPIATAEVSTREPQAPTPAIPTIPDGPSRNDEVPWMRTLLQHQGERPNLLLVMLESVPHDHLGYTGYERDVTPRIDAIAAQALRMRRVWSAATQSNYAQMAILSSLDPKRRTTLDVYEQLDFPRVLPQDIFHLLGYATATISSQNEDWQGMRRFQTTATPTTFLDARDHPGPHIGTGTEGKLPDHLTVDVALRWLGEVKGKPFALYLNLQRTHFPYELPEGVEAPFQPADPDPSSFGFLGYPAEDVPKALNRYDNALRYVDAQVGRIYDYLAASGQLENTLLVIVADHGEAFHDQGEVTHGKSLREPQARVPLLLHWPGHIAPADELRPVSTLDIMPTVLDLFGLPIHPAYQGRSFIRRPAAAEPAILMTLQGLLYADALVCWPYKVVHEGSHNRILLFDLQADPGEQRNLMSRSHPAARALGPLLLAQIKAQLAYHADQAALNARFAPRMPPCPAF